MANRNGSSAQLLRPIASDGIGECSAYTKSSKVIESATNHLKSDGQPLWRGANGNGECRTLWHEIERAGHIQSPVAAIEFCLVKVAIPHIDGWRGPRHGRADQRVVVTEDVS